LRPCRRTDTNTILLSRAANGLSSTPQRTRTSTTIVDV